MYGHLNVLTFREDLNKKNYIFYDIVLIRFQTSPPLPIYDEKIYDNLVGIFDLPPLQNLEQISFIIFYHLLDVRV